MILNVFHAFIDAFEVFLSKGKNDYKTYKLEFNVSDS